MMSGLVGQESPPEGESGGVGFGEGWRKGGFWKERSQAARGEQRAEPPAATWSR
jgi:hypothetical protein